MITQYSMKSFSLAFIKNQKENAPVIGDFLDAFYAAPIESGQAMIEESPVLCAGEIENGKIMEAFLAATGEYLSWRFGLRTPSWTASPDRILSEPWFADNNVKLKKLLAKESPASFRRRNLFVSHNVLSRA